MLTKQEIFDKIVQHYLINKQPYSVINGGCAYRGEHIAKCAVGLFIPDNEYDPIMETGGLSDLLDRGLVVGETKDLLEKHYELFRDLQDAHDNASLKNEQEKFRTDFARRLSGIAFLHKLNVKLLLTYKE